jgi:hypothetical protein
MYSIGIAFPQQKNESEKLTRKSLLTPDIERSSNIPIRCPKKTTLLPDTTTDTVVSESDEKYKITATSGLYDPTAIHTPPTDFMKQLKERMSVYFTPKADII